MVGAVGMMLMPVIVAEVTVRLALADVMPLKEADMFVLPTAMPVATPVLLTIVATAVLLDAHVT